MFKEESLWIKNALGKIQPTDKTNEVANIGSSTEHFRTVVQPHIYHNIIRYLDNTGWDVLNVDMKPEQGVDMVADVTNPAFADHQKNRFGLTICTNLLEHVEDIDLVVQNLIDITQHNGYILLTVPHKYKLHYDPIDNGFRPTPFEIAGRFLRLGTPINVIDESIITIQQIEYYRIKKSKIPLWGHRERLQYYLGKRHKVSGILLQIEKPGQPITFEKKVHYRGIQKPAARRTIKSYFF